MGGLSLPRKLDVDKLSHSATAEISVANYKFDVMLISSISKVLWTAGCIWLYNLMSCKVFILGYTALPSHIYPFQSTSVNCPITAASICDRAFCKTVYTRRVFPGSKYGTYALRACLIRIMSLSPVAEDPCRRLLGRGRARCSTLEWTHLTYGHVTH